ncbi:hypothetical protein [Deinococcus roseus]|uniref:HEAT repeat domain-containing protein n=1 Tax=Deinococcus roseus TaxID=392414 RepID=A0ABQ2DM06_9DEIO|nr:hypothetical protein [Deinococcus roseus]GGJ59375.1 hypothetical protein GCM10008938_51900 [Deinococcus roseus]
MTELPSEQDIREVLLEMAHSEDRTGWGDVKLQLFSLPEDLLLPVLREGVQDVDPMVRCQAGTLLMDLQGGRHVEFYQSLFRDPEDWVRWNITGKASTLQEVNLDHGIRERLLTDEEVSVQVVATCYLNEVVGPSSIPFLLWLITHPTEPDLLGHTRNSAAEGSLTSLLLWHASGLDAEVLI